MNAGGYSNREHERRVKQNEEAVAILLELYAEPEPPERTRDVLLLKLLVTDIRPHSPYERMGMKRAVRRAIKALEKENAEKDK